VDLTGPTPVLSVVHSLVLAKAKGGAVIVERGAGKKVAAASNRPPTAPEAEAGLAK
jgi:hypothetical protein